MEFSSQILNKPCLNLSKINEKNGSPKTPTNSLKRKGTDFCPGSSPYASTPKSCKLLNIFGEDSPTQNYYDQCSLSQKMLIDDERDVVWNWEVDKATEVKRKSTNTKINISKPEFFQKNKKNKAKPIRCCEGLQRLQVLQELKKSNDNAFSTCLNSSWNKYNLPEKNNEFLTERKNVDIAHIKENADPDANEIFKKSPKNCSSYEEDQILYQLSQNIEEKEIKGISENITSIHNIKCSRKVSKFNMNSGGQTELNILEKDFAIQNDKKLTPEYEDSFDEVLLSIDLSLINDSKKSQFQRHNSMPSCKNENNIKAKSWIRYGSDHSINNNPGLEKLHFDASNLNDKSATKNNNKISNHSENSYATCSNAQTMRCSKEEVEAKRLEAKRKRLLRMNKMQQKN